VKLTKAIRSRKLLWKYVAPAWKAPPKNGWSIPTSQLSDFSGLRSGLPGMPKPPNWSKKLGALMPLPQALCSRVSVTGATAASVRRGENAWPNAVPSS